MAARSALTVVDAVVVTVHYGRGSCHGFIGSYSPSNEASTPCRGHRELVPFSDSSFWFGIQVRFQPFGLIPASPVLAPRSCGPKSRSRAP